MGYQAYDPRSYDERLKEYMLQQQLGKTPSYAGSDYAAPPQDPTAGLGGVLGGVGAKWAGSKLGGFFTGGGDPVTTFGGSGGADSFASLANTGGAEASTNITNFAGSATPYLGGAGAALGAYGAIKGIKDKNPIGAGLGGAGVGLGLNAMGLALGPVGWAAMLASPIAMALINKMGDKDRWKEEQSRRNKLADSGVTGWALYNSMQPKLTKGRSFASMNRGDLAKDFIGFAGKDGKSDWVNNKFNSSRDVKDLRPEDIWGYSAFGEKYGNDWFGKFNENQRREIAKTYLDAGAVSEGRGQISLKSDASLDEKIKKYLEGAKKK